MPVVDTPTQAPSDDLDEVGRILMKAADIVDVRWQQFGYGELGGPRCARGAILESADAGPNLSYAIDRLTKFLCMPIIYYNDTPGRKAAEVSAAMRAAARMAND